MRRLPRTRIYEHPQGQGQDWSTLGHGSVAIHQSADFVFEQKIQDPEEDGTTKELGEEPEELWTQNKLTQHCRVSDDMAIDCNVSEVSAEPRTSSSSSSASDFSDFLRTSSAIVMVLPKSGWLTIDAWMLSGDRSICGAAILLAACTVGSTTPPEGAKAVVLANSNWTAAKAIVELVDR